MVAMVAVPPIFSFLNQSHPDPTVHANGGPQGHHLYWPFQWLVPVTPAPAVHACGKLYKRAGSPDPLLTFWLDVA